MHYPVIEFGAIDSTNTEAQRRAAQGERGPVWLRADQQRVGRGRSGRAWTSPVGNLSATLLFTPNCPLDKLHQLSLVIGVAAFDAIAAFLKQANTAAQCQLKWPNDIMINRMKTGGILVETSIYGTDTVAIVGCGINIAVAPDVADRRVTALAEYGICPTPGDFLTRFDQELHGQITVWSGGEGFPSIRDAWLDRSFPIDELMSINTNEGPVVGKFAGLATDGALLLKPSTGNVRRFHFGDVALGGAAATPGNGETENL